MSYKIVAARFNENISWLDSVSDNCIIYNKGNSLNHKNEIFIPNLGRESETYLHYIIDNYHNLPDVIVFTQGKISDHRGKNDVSILLKLKDEALEKGKSEPNVRHNMKNGYCWGPEWNKYNDDHYYLHGNYKDNKPIVFIEWFKKNICSEYPYHICIYSNAIFAVKKELVLKNNKNYYENLIKEVNHHVNSTEGHFFERSWYYIFGGEPM